MAEVVLPGDAVAELPFGAPALPDVPGDVVPNDLPLPEGETIDTQVETAPVLVPTEAGEGAVVTLGLDAVPPESTPPASPPAIGEPQVVLPEAVAMLPDPVPDFLSLDGGFSFLLSGEAPFEFGSGLDLPAGATAALPLDAVPPSFVIPDATPPVVDLPGPAESANPLGSVVPDATPPDIAAAASDAPVPANDGGAPALHAADILSDLAGAEADVPQLVAALTPIDPVPPTVTPPEVSAPDAVLPTVTLPDAAIAYLPLTPVPPLDTPPDGVVP